MNNIRFASLVIQTFWGFASYDLIRKACGFSRIYHRLTRLGVAAHPLDPQIEVVISRAIDVAACFYWKPVLCLQRSAVMAAALRKRGIHANLVIGYRREPFFSHAWVEVEGRVLNDSPAYKQRLQILCRI